MINDGLESARLSATGIRGYPNSSYLLQSLFIRLTGYQEQKMKSIAWDVATHDFDFRREYIENINKWGEFTTWDTRKKFFETLYKHYRLTSGNILITPDEVQSKLEAVRNELINSLLESQVSQSNIRSLKYVMDDSNYNWSNVCVENMKQGDGVLQKFSSVSLVKKDSDLYTRSEQMVRWRHRIAHNTQSYQQDYPKLNTLRMNDSGIVYNYFEWYLLILIIDEMFVELYKKIIDMQNLN